MGDCLSLQIGIDQDVFIGAHEPVFFTEIGLGKSMAIGSNSVAYGATVQGAHSRYRQNCGYLFQIIGRYKLLLSIFMMIITNVIKRGVKVCNNQYIRF